MAKREIFVNIDDISKEGKEIKLREDADVFEREGTSGFRKIGRVQGGGFSRGQLTAEERRRQQQADALRRQQEEAEQKIIRAEAEAKVRAQAQARREERRQRAKQGTISGQIKGQDTGVLTVTESEFRQFSSQPNEPVFVNPGKLTASQGAQVGTQIGGLGLTNRLTFTATQPEASVRAGQRRLSSAREQIIGNLGGQTIAPEFATQRGNEVADQLLLRRDPKVVSASRFTEFGVGGAQLGVGLAEFNVNLLRDFGTVRIESGSTKEDRKFRFGGQLGAIREQDRGFGTLLGQTFTATPFVVPAVASIGSSIGSVGVRTTAGNVAGSLSPLRLAPGTFGALEGGRASQDILFTVRSVRATTSGGLTVRRIVGTGPGTPFGPTTIQSTQITRNVKGVGEVGIGSTTINAPTVTISGPGRFDVGLRTVQTESVIGSQTAKGFLGGKLGGNTVVSTNEAVKGFIGGTQTRTRADLLFTTTGGGRGSAVIGSITPRGSFTRDISGGLSSTKDEITTFISGRGFREGRGVSTRNIDIKGIERELKLPKDSSSITGSGGRGSIGPLETTTATSTDTAGSTLSSSIKRATSGSSPVSVVSTEFPSIISQGGTKTSQFFGTGIDLIPGQITGSTTLERINIAQPQQQINSVGIIPGPLEFRGTNPPIISTSPTITTLTGSSQGSRSGSTGRPRIDTQPNIGISPIQGITPGITPILQTPTIQRQINTFPGRGGGFGRFRFESPPIGRGLPVIGGGLPTLGGGAFGSGGFNFPKTRIAPSLTGITLFQVGGITGDLPSGEGIGVLPTSLRLVPTTRKKRKSRRKK